MYDICIVGAGPAGATFARLVGKKYKVLILDKRDLGDEQIKSSYNKCCGGLLAPDAQKMFAKLGLGIPKSILVDPQLFAVRTIDINSKMERYYQRFYYNMDRVKFDKWLISLIPKEVHKKFNCLFKDFKKIPEGYQVNYITSNGEKTSVKCKILVGADGGFSRIRRIALREKKAPKTYISVQQWFERPEDVPFFTAIFDKDISDFYSWIIPKGDNWLLGAALHPKEHPREKFDLLKTRLKDFGFDFGNEIKTEGAFIYRPTSISSLCTGISNIALIGEAAGAISPSSAEGFSYALKSAVALANSLNKGIDSFHKSYEHNIKAIRRNVFLKNLKSTVMYRPFLRKLAMKSGFESMSFPLDKDTGRDY